MYYNIIIIIPYYNIISKRW